MRDIGNTFGPKDSRLVPACMSRGRSSRDHIHKADHPNLVTDLLDADGLAGEDGAEIDLRRLQQMRPHVVTVAILWWNGSSTLGRPV
jgi:hypothetical protein